MQMSDSAVHRRQVLPRGSILSIRDARETVIYVLRGCVWVTQQGDAQDRVLGPGDWFRLDRHGLAIVQAFERSALALTGPRDAPANAFWRIWAALFAPVSRRQLPTL